MRRRISFSPYSLVMGLIVTFGKMADCKYDGGSIDYNGAEVSVRNGRICGSRGFFFSLSLMEAGLLGLTVHSLSLTAPQL